MAKSKSKSQKVVVQNIVDDLSSRLGPIAENSITDDSWRTKTDKDYTAEKNREFLDYWKGCGHIGEDQLELLRKDLHNSTPLIEGRKWVEVLALPEDITIEELDQFKCSYLADGDKPWGPSAPASLNTLRETVAPDGRPLMLCEYGFGFTTFTILDYCLRNNGYLVTVEMPVSPREKINAKNREELFYWGVDRYIGKHAWCRKLQEKMKKRWLWINDDIFDVSDRIVNDKTYRDRLFLNGKIDWFMDDAIHEYAFGKKLHERMRPHLSPGSFFYSGHNHQRWE